MPAIAEPPILVAASVAQGNLSVEVSGDLDIATASRLEEAMLMASHDGIVVLDLSGVRFIDAYGVRCLLACRHFGHGLVLRNPSGVVRRLLALARATEEFVIEETVSSP